MKSLIKVLSLAFLLSSIGCTSTKQEETEIISSSNFLAIGDSVYSFQSDAEFFENEKEWDSSTDLPLEVHEYFFRASTAANKIIGTKTAWELRDFTVKKGWRQPWQIVVTIQTPKSELQFAMIPMSINGTTFPYEKTDLPVEDLIANQSSNKTR